MIAAEVLEDAEDDMDAELAELFARNETTLKQIRRDVKQVKKCRDAPAGPARRARPAEGDRGVYNMMEKIWHA